MVRFIRFIERAISVAAATAFLTTALPSAPAAGQSQEIYVSAEDSGEIVAIDQDKATVIARIPVGKRPRGIKVSRDGKFLYVALSGSPKAAPGADESKLPPPDRAADGVGVVELSSRKLLRVLASGQDPESFDLSPDGRTLYVSNEETAEMTALDLTAGKVVGRVTVGKEPEGVTVRPDGRVVYVTAEEDNAVFAVDAATFKVLGQATTGARPRSIVFAKNGATAFVTAELGGLVSVLQIGKKTMKPAGAIKIEAQAKTPLGPRPMGAVLSPDGKQLFVSNGRGQSVAVIDVARRKVVRLIDGVGARPWGIGVSHDGKRLFTANGPSDDVSVIDVAAGRVEARVKVGGMPWGLVVAPPATNR